MRIGHEYNAPKIQVWNWSLNCIQKGTALLKGELSLESIFIVKNWNYPEISWGGQGPWHRFNLKKELLYHLSHQYWRQRTAVESSDLPAVRSGLLGLWNHSSPLGSTATRARRHFSAHTRLWAKNEGWGWGSSSWSTTLPRSQWCKLRSPGLRQLFE